MNLKSRIVARRGVEKTLEGGTAESGGAHVGVRGRWRASRRRLLRAWLTGGGVGVAAGGHDGGGAGKSRSDLGGKAIWELGFGEEEAGDETTDKIGRAHV